MKQIKPIKVFFHNGLKELKFLNVISVFDNLVDHVRFEYSVFVNEQEAAGGGVVELIGLDNYQTWDASANGAYVLVAKTLGVELEG